MLACRPHLCRGEDLDSGRLIENCLCQDMGRRIGIARVHDGQRDLHLPVLVVVCKHRQLALRQPSALGTTSVLMHPSFQCAGGGERVRSFVVIIDLPQDDIGNVLDESVV